MLTIQADEAKIRRVQKTLAAFPRAAGKVISRAINKVATGARAEVVRAIAGQIAVKQSELRAQNVRLDKASYRLWRAQVRVTGRRIPLKRFGARQTRRGVTYRIRKSGGRGTATGAFLAIMDTGHVGVFGRRPGWTHRFPRGRASGRKHGLAIQELYGPSVPEVMKNAVDLAAERLDRRIAERLDAEIDRQLAFVMERIG